MSNIGAITWPDSKAWSRDRAQMRPNPISHSEEFRRLRAPHVAKEPYTVTKGLSTPSKRHSSVFRPSAAIFLAASNGPTHESYGGGGGGNGPVCPPLWSLLLEQQLLSPFPEGAMRIFQDQSHLWGLVSYTYDWLRWCKTWGSTTLSTKPPAVVALEGIVVSRHRKSSAACAVSVEFSARADGICGHFFATAELMSFGRAVEAGT